MNMIDITDLESAPPSPVKILDKTQEEGAPLLFNHKAPFHVNKKERPIHRVMIELAAKGYNNREIADMTERSAVNVNNALRQPHSQQFLADTIRAKVSEDERVVELIKDNAFALADKLVKLALAPTTHPRDVIAAANSILDRRYGKANQPINRGSDVDLNKLTDEELYSMCPTRSTATS